MTARTLLLLFLALLAIIFLVFFCLPNTAQQIEADISSRSTQALNAAGIDTVQVAADGQTIILNGVVADEASKQQVGTLVAEQTGVISVDNQLRVATAAASRANIGIADYEYTLEFDGEQLRLTGAVPDVKTKTGIISQAEAAFGADSVTDNLSIAKDASPQVASIIEEHLITSLENFSHGKVIISSSKLSVTGSVESAEQRDFLRQRISAALPQSYLPIYSISVAGEANNAASHCQNKFAQLLGKEKIRFSVNKAAISQPSHRLLNALAATAAECPNAKIEVAGHTDSSGGAQLNQALSQRRAQAVVDFLIEKKVKNSLTAKGYGESKPIANNSTVKGKALNRRIEFKVH